MSPNCSDVVFRPKTIMSRPGFGLRFTDGSAFCGIKSFYGQDRIRRLAVLQANGRISVESPEGQLQQFWNMSQDVGMLSSVYAFGRLWTCVSDGQRPLDFPLVYDPTPQGSGSKVGPVNTSAPIAAATGADSATAGLITAGLHYFFYTYEDIYGYVTQQSPVGSWTAAGGKKADFSNLLVSPGFYGAVVRRRLWMTPAYVTGSGVAGFFNVGALVLENNTGTTLSGVSITDATLQTGVRWATDNQTIVPVPPALGVTKYADRLVYWGVYPEIVPRLAQRIDGAGSDIVLLGRPLVDFSSIAGWTVDAGSPSIGTTSGFTRTGSFLTMLSGAHLHKDFPNSLTSTEASPQYWLKPANSYGVLTRLGSVNGGTVVITLSGQSPSKTLATGTFVIPASPQIDSSPNPEFRFFVLSADASDPVPDAEATIRIDIQCTAGAVSIDWIRPYLMSEKFDGSTLWIGDNQVPQNFDLTKSLLPVAPGDWQEMRCCFEQTGNLYIVKEHSTWVTSDNGQDPTTWNVDNVSFQMGTPSSHGVGLGPEFAIIAGREGVYRFDSGGINKISQEIETTWGGIDWTQGYRLWVTVDATLKVIRVGVPLKGRAGNVCHVILKCDYVEGWAEPWQSDEESVSAAGSRKWTIDRVETICGEMSEKDDGSHNLLVGGASVTSNLNGGYFGATVQLGTRTATITSAQPQPMGTTTHFGERFSFPFSSGTARYAGKPSTTFLGLGTYFVASIWMQSPTPGVNVPAIVRDPFGLTDLPITITPNWQRFVAVFGPNPVAPYTITDGDLPVASNVLTSASGLFTAGDVGKDIVIPNGGSGSSPLYTTVASFISATSITLTLPNQSGFHLGSQHATLGKLPALDLDWGTLTAPILVGLFGFQIQDGQVDRGWSGIDGSGNYYYGTGLPSGFLAEPIVYDPGSDPPWKTSDWNGVIEVVYEFAPFGLPLGRSNFNKIIARIRGSGALEAYFVRPDGSTIPLNAGTFPLMNTNPTNDIEMGGSDQDSYVGVRLLTQGLSSWFSLKRFGIFSRGHEGAPFRGKS